MSGIFASPRRGAALVTMGVVIAAALPWLGSALRGPTPPRCVADGVPLSTEDPCVRLDWADGSSRDFCCVGCAEAWARAASPSPVAVQVTDEASGRLIDARRAHFVASRVVAQPATRDRVHAFADESEARRHADAYRGSFLTGDERPFGAAR